MAKPREVWDRAKFLYEAGHGYREVSRLLKNEGIELSHPVIYERMKKEGWKQKIVESTTAAMAEYWNKEDEEAKAVLSVEELKQLMPPPARNDPELLIIKDAMNQLKTSLFLGLDLKVEVLRDTLTKFRSGEINGMTATKIISNLGLNAINIARMLGIGVDATLVPAPEKEVGESQIQVYIPDNNRN